MKLPTLKQSKLFIAGILLLLVQSIFAQSFIISPLPLPQQEVLNIHTDKCNNSCLLDYFSKEQLFSFLAFFDTQNEDAELRAKLAITLQDLGFSIQVPTQPKGGNAEIKLALLMPKKVIGRYSVSSIDTILAYLMARGNDFLFEVFDTGDESADSIKQTYSKIANGGYDFVIAILTNNGAQEIAKLHIAIPTYLPTINKNQIQSNRINENLLFGGVDYEAQIDLLLSLAGNKPIVAFNDSSTIGNNLAKILKSRSDSVVFEESVNYQAATTFSQRLEKYETYIDDNIVFFNTSYTKTGLMAAQLVLAKNQPSKLLSTQINFNPSLLMLIQKDDRKNLYITNIINNKNQKLVEYASLLGGDLRYEWVNYATAIGVEQLMGARISDEDRFFQEKIKDGQVEYINKIYKNNAKRFYEYR